MARRSPTTKLSARDSASTSSRTEANWISGTRNNRRNGVLLMKSFLLTIALCSAVLPVLHSFADELAGGCQCGSSTCGHRCPACPKCSHKICTVSVEKTKEEHHCFNVECKEICVPKITLPCWTDAIPFFKCKDKSCECGDKCPTKECCDAPRCGYVKVVKVLKKHEYECDSCGYKWKIEEPCNACPSGACSTGACVTRGQAAPATPASVELRVQQPRAPQQATYHGPAPVVRSLPARSPQQGADLRFAP